MGIQIKVCGLNDSQNIKALKALQLDYMGFIFWKPSKRFCAINTLELTSDKTKKVGVFVNEDIVVIKQKIESFGLDAIQLHGDETADFCAKLKAENITIIKSLSIDDAFDFNALNDFEKVVDYFLFDTKGKLPGGNGYAFDWQILNQYALKTPYFLSGGLALPHALAIKEFLKTSAGQKCVALDLNSQFETQPGIKNVELIKQFKDVIYS